MLKDSSHEAPPKAFHFRDFAVGNLLPMFNAMCTRSRFVCVLLAAVYELSVVLCCAAIASTLCSSIGPPCSQLQKLFGSPGVAHRNSDLGPAPESNPQLNLKQIEGPKPVLAMIPFLRPCSTIPSTHIQCKPKYSQYRHFLTSLYIVFIIHLYYIHIYMYMFSTLYGTLKSTLAQ